MSCRRAWTCRTTAKGSEATISGSVNALKSAVSNLIVGFGDADADMELLYNNMVVGFKNVVGYPRLLEEHRGGSAHAGCPC